MPMNYVSVCSMHYVILLHCLLAVDFSSFDHLGCFALFSFASEGECILSIGTRVIKEVFLNGAWLAALLSNVYGMVFTLFN